MASIKVSKMDMATAWEIPWKCWELTKKNYITALLLVVTMIPLAMLNLVPYIGAFIASILLSLWAIGVFCMVKEWEEGRQPGFDFFIKKIQEKSKDKKLHPIIGAAALLSMMSGIATKSSIGMFPTTVITVGSMVIGFWLALAMAQIIFHPQVDYYDALKNAFSSIVQNIFPLVFVWILYWFFGFICFLMLVLPGIFIFLPATISFNYILYRVVLEGLSLQTDENSEIKI